MRERSPEAHPIARLPGWVTAMNSLRSARMVSGAHCSVRGVRKTDVLGTDAAIDFDLDGREAAPDELGPQPRHLGDRPGDERLPAEARIDRHDKRDVDVG